MTLGVWRATLLSTANGWDQQAEALAGALSSLNRADTSLLGPRVAAAAEDFLATWRAQLKSQIAEAERTADSLRATAQSYFVTDAGAQASISQLVPGGQQGLAPGPAPLLGRLP